jgi:uncharacterized protein (DUF1697 family)
MPTFVILLKGVNVGKAKRVPIADFKALLLALGCHSANTLLNSGNAVVTAPGSSASALAGKVSRAIADRFGFDVPVVAKTAAELDHIVRASPLTPAPDDHSRVLVAFAQDRAGLEALRALAGLVAPPEQLLVQEQAAYLHCPAGILGSKAAAALLGRLGSVVTTRNRATVLKLHALAQGAS